MKHTYVVLTFILLASPWNSYGMETNPQATHVISDNQFPPFQRAVWAKIKHTIEAKEKIKLPDLDTTNINHTLKIEDCERLVLYLLVMYALNTSQSQRVEHYLDFIRHALENGADVDGFAGSETALMYLARFTSQQDPSSLYYKSDDRVMKVLQLLLEKKPNLNLQHGQHQGTALLMAIGNVYNKTTCEVVNALLVANADPNIPNIDAQTPVMQATRTGNINLIKLLVNHDADLENLDITGVSGSTKDYLTICRELQEVNRKLKQIAVKVEDLAEKRQLERQIQNQETKIESSLNRSIHANEKERRMQRGMQRQPSDD